MDLPATLCPGNDTNLLDDGRLPDASGHVVRDTLSLDVHAGPLLALLVLGTQLVEDLHAVDARVVAQLLRNDLKHLLEIVS